MTGVNGLGPDLGLAKNLWHPYSKLGHDLCQLHGFIASRLATLGNSGDYSSSSSLSPTKFATKGVQSFRHEV